MGCPTVLDDEDDDSNEWDNKPLLEGKTRQSKAEESKGIGMVWQSKKRGAGAVRCAPRMNGEDGGRGMTTDGRLRWRKALGSLGSGRGGVEPVAEVSVRTRVDDG